MSAKSTRFSKKIYKSVSRQYLTNKFIYVNLASVLVGITFTQVYRRVEMKILLCDDEQEHLDILRIHVEEYMKNHFIKAEYTATLSSTSVVQNDEPYDLAFLDIQMDKFL